MVPDEVVDQLVAELKTGIDVEYMFKSLSRAEWIEPLARRGFFASAPPAIYEGDYVRYPDWPAGRYLQRVAAQEPRAVAGLLAELRDTDNARVLDLIVRIAQELPAEEVLEVSRRIQQWLVEDRRFLFLDELAKLCVHLDAVGKTRASQRLFKLIFRTTVAEGGHRLVGRDSEWHNREAMRLVIDGVEPSQHWLDTAAGLLEEALEALRFTRDDPPHDGSNHLRPAIEDSGQNEYHDEALMSSVNAVRDVALALIRQGRMSCSDVVERLEARSWSMFHRIALWLIHEELPATRELALERLHSRTLMVAPELHHEYWLLARDALPLMIDTEVDAFLAMLKEACSENEDPHRAAARESRRLAILGSDRPAVLVRQGQLRQAFDLASPENPEFLSYMSAGFVGPTSPVDVVQLSAMSDDEVFEYLKNWLDSGDWMSPSREGLARVLQELVAADAGRLVGLGERLRDLPPVYLYALLEGWAASVRQDRVPAWPEVLSLASWCVSQGIDPGAMTADDGDGAVPTWAAVRRSAMHLLSEGLQSGPCEIPAELRALTWEVLEPVTTDPEPSPDYEARYGGDNMEPTMLSLNTNRGAAMHALIRFALWVDRRDASAGIATEVRAVLEAHLDVEHDPSLAVRSVYGQWLPWLIHMDREWVESHLEDIFPASPEAAPLAEAAWTAYITMCAPYDSCLEVLRQQYLHAAEDVGDDGPSTWTREDPRAHLADHLAMFVLRGRLALDDELLTTFLERARDGLRERLLAEAGRLVRDVPESEAAVLERAMSLLEMRLTRVRGGQPSKELEGFGWWLDANGLPLQWRVGQLNAVLALTNGQVDLEHGVLELLAQAVTSEPVGAVSAALRLVEGDREDWRVLGSREELQTIIATGRLAGGRAAELATDLGNLLVTRGHLEFRDLLED